MRTCTKCTIEQKDDQFYQNPKTGYWQSWCKTCKKEQEAGSRRKKGVKERVFAKVSDTHKECMNCNKMLPHKNFSPSKRGSKGLLAYCKSCQKEKYYDKEKCRLATAKYRKLNRIRWNSLHRINQAERRLKIKVVDDGTLTEKSLTLILSEPYCFWCQEYTEEVDRTLEHIVELSNGGTHSEENCTMSCFKCNSSRPNRNGKFDYLGKGEEDD